MDSIDDFEFKPITEGLGFNKKTEPPPAFGSRIKEKTTAIEDQSTRSMAPQPPPSFAIPNDFQLDFQSESDLLGRDLAKPSKIIADLISSLPPSMDFKDELNGEFAEAKSQSTTGDRGQIFLSPEIEPNMNLPDGSRPQIFQPFAREDFMVGPGQTNSIQLNGAHGNTIDRAIGSKVSPSHSAAPTLSSSTASMPSSSARSPLPAHGNKAKFEKTSSPYLDRLNESFNRAFPHAQRKANINDLNSNLETAKLKPTSQRKNVDQTEGLELLPAHLGAGFIDAMVVVGMSAILLVAIVAITGVNLNGLLSNVRTDSPTQIHIALLFIACLHLYLLTARSFFGSSLGEWAFDLQLGSSGDQKATVYPLQVAWRTILVTLTGVVLLPLISLIFKRDLAKFLTGLQLYMRKV